MKFRRLKKENGYVDISFTPGKGFHGGHIGVQGKLQVRILGIRWTIKKYQFNIPEK